MALSRGSGGPSLTRRTPYLWLAALLGLLLASHARYGWAIFVDDPFISFRYARNLVESHGLVFNPGERVEGYTNFLWTVLMALPMTLGGDPVRWSKVFGVAANLGTVTVLWQASRRRGLHPVWAALAPLLLVLEPAFVRWGGGGMETPLFTLLVTSAVTARWAKPGTRLRRWGPSVLVGLAAMTRPEGLLVAGLIGLDELLPDEPGRRRSPGRALRFGLGFAALFLPYFLWRWSYYGALLPNTFHAKFDGTWDQVVTGLGYWSYHIRNAGGLLYPLLIIAAAWRRLGRSDVRLPLVLVLTYSGYIVLVGGDWMAHHRFFIPLIPLELLLVTRGLDRLWKARRGRGPARVLVGIAVLWLLMDPLIPDSPLVSQGIHDAKFYIRHGQSRPRRDLPNPQRLQWRVVEREDWIERDRDLGLWLKENAPPGSSIALGAVGIIPYYSGLPTIDWFGLTEPAIARTRGSSRLQITGHRRMDVDLVLHRKPTYIIFSGRNPEEASRGGGYWARTLGFANRPEFQQNYRRELVDTGRHQFHLHRRVPSD